MSCIYAIKKHPDTGRLQFLQIPILFHSCSDDELRQAFDYSTSLSDAYSSGLCRLSQQTPISYRNIRQEAYNMGKALEEIKRNPDIIAYSHRFGGYKHFDWNFNEDISFHIYTNFGYGSVSDFCSTFYYKNAPLAPYSHFVTYRYAGYTDVVKCTHQYSLNYDRWRDVMMDCRNFYNAVVDGEEHYLFTWLINHLNKMVSGLETILASNSYRVIDGGIVIGGKQIYLSGDDFLTFQADKIADSIRFIENIKALPVQVNPRHHVDRIMNVCRKFMPILQRKIVEVEKEYTEAVKKVEELESFEDYQLYQFLKSKYYWKKNWYLSSNSFRMVSFLMKLLRHRNYPISMSELRERLKVLNKRIALIEEAHKMRTHLKELLDSLKKSCSSLESNIEIYSGNIIANAI